MTSTSVLIIQFNQHPDVPHLSGGWIILREVRTNTKFDSNIPIVYIETVLDFFISTRGKWERKQKCCAYLFVKCT